LSNDAKGLPGGRRELLDQEERGAHRGLSEAAPALSVIGLGGLASLALGSRAGAAMFGASFVAIAGAALLGWPRRSLTAVGLGVAGIVWLVLLGVIGQPGIRSAIAHAIAGALLGWALADGILRTPGARAEPGRVLGAVVLATLAVGVIWEPRLPCPASRLRQGQRASDRQSPEITFGLWTRSGSRRRE
jgi:hypothetical protein